MQNSVYSKLPLARIVIVVGPGFVSDGEVGSMGNGVVDEIKALQIDSKRVTALEQRQQRAKQRKEISDVRVKRIYVEGLKGKWCMRVYSIQHLRTTK